MAGAGKEHETQNPVHQEGFQIETSYGPDQICHRGARSEHFDQKPDHTDDHRKEHERDLVGEMGKPLVNDAKDDNEDHKNDEYIECVLHGDRFLY